MEMMAQAHGGEISFRIGITVDGRNLTRMARSLSLLANPVRGG
jgi:hypothetical protein